jgi:hypothetical protein
MIEANEYYLFVTAKEIGIDEVKIKKLIERFEGWRIYFRKRTGERERIVTLYNQMLEAGNSKKQSISELSKIFDKPAYKIRYIIAKQKELF